MYLQGREDLCCFNFGHALNMQDPAYSTLTKVESYRKEAFVFCCDPSATEGLPCFFFSLQFWVSLIRSKVVHSLLTTDYQ